MVRPAKFADVIAMRALLVAAHAQSVYAERCGVDLDYAQKLLVQSVHATEKRCAGGTCAFVAESQRPGEVDGFIIGMLDRVYLIGDKLVAQDMFYLAPTASAGDGLKLFDRYLEWAMSNPRVIEIQASATAVIEPTSRVEKLFKRRGFEPFGVIYRKGIA